MEEMSRMFSGAAIDMTENKKQADSIAVRLQPVKKGRMPKNPQRKAWQKVMKPPL